MQVLPKKLELLQCYKNTTVNKVNSNYSKSETNIKSIIKDKELCNKDNEQNDKMINFRKFNFNKSSKHRSFSSEVTIPLKINGVNLYGLLDSGSESSILSLDYANKFFKNWRNFEDGFYKLDFGVGVDGSRFNILGTKMFTVQIGSTVLASSFSIPERGTELIIGLDLLKLFNISMKFSSEIHLYCNEEHITSEFIENNNKILTSYNKKCVLYPNETKMILVKNDELIDDMTYLSYSDENSSSIVVPSTSVSKNGVLSVIIKNDSKKKTVFKPNSLKIKVEEINADDIYSIQDMEAKTIILESEVLPTLFFNKNCTFNNDYYSNTNENMTKCNFLNNMFDTNNTDKNLSESEDTLSKLSQLPGLELPEIKFPIKSANDIVKEYLQGKYTKDQKEFLENEFKKYPELISRYSYDCGKMKDYKGDLILMDIPLKAKIPKMTKTYKLSPDEKKAMNDILDFQIYFNLAENAKNTNLCGSPCFLVDRPDKNRGHRIIFDVREVNKYISAPVSTYSDCVTTPLKTILSKYDYLSCVDLRSAYYSIRLSPKSLESNISQVITDERCVRFFGPPTGLSYIPVFWADNVNKQMSLNDEGLFDPLSSPASFFKAWFDDLSIATVGNDKLHKEYLQKFLYRINRLGLKINLEKSEFFIKVQSDNFKLLGFEVEGGRIIPNKKKLNVLKDFKSPKSTQEVQQYLGYLTFIRHLLPLKVMELTTTLTPLTSALTPFKWNDEHENAFNKINELLDSSISYAEPQSENSIKIIYSDASEKLLGGILFCYNIDFFEQDPPINLLSIGQAYKPHTEFYKIECKKFASSKTEMSQFKNFIHLVSTSNHFHEDYEWNDNYISLYLNGFFGAILKIRTFFTSNEHLNEFLDQICSNEVSDEFFMNNFMEFLAITSVLFKSNIKLLFGNNKIQKKPYFCFFEDFENDILMGFDTEKSTFTLFYVLEQFELGDQKIRSNNKISPQNTSPKKVFEHFKETLKSDTAKKHIKLVSQFSKSIPKSEQHQAIYLKESAALLYSLEAFKNDIKNAPLTLIATDSRVSFFLFNPDVQNSSKKLIRWSLKIALSFKNVHVLNIAGKDNISDFLSRLGLSKQTFFTRTLCPLKINSEERQKLPELLTWADITKYCETNPELIKFSERKISTQIQNEYYLDLLSTNEHFQCNSLKLFMEQRNFIDKFLTREELIKNQSKEPKIEDSVEHNGVIFYNDLPVLPLNLYIPCIMREHILGLHLGTVSLLKTCTNIFYIKDKKYLKTLIEKLCGACLACILVKSAKNKQKFGMFEVNKANICVQMDFVEDLPSKNKFLLVLIDLYSRFCTTYVLQNKKTASVLNCLRNYLSNFGIIKYLITDNYSGFRSKEFMKFTKVHGITHPTSAPYKSRARAYVELYNGVLQRSLKNLTIFERENWADLIPLVTFLLNNRIFYNETKTPSQLHFGMSNLRHDFMRPEQRELFLSLIPKNFLDSEKKYVDIINKEEEEFNERRIKNLKKRQERINRKKTDTKLKIDDYVVIKSYGDVIGVSRKLKLIYENVPYRIVQIKYYNCILLNILDGTQVLRAIDDVKKVEILNSEDDNFNKIPKQVFDMLNIITISNIKDIFAKKNDETQEIKEPRTRSEFVNDNDREKQLLMEEMLDLDNEDSFNIERHVTFED